MAEAVPAVALLFDDAGLGEQLRAALQERGARIVHEGPLKDLSRQLLSSVDADVLVVNLDDEDDSALDRLDDTLDGDRPRVVFNDAQASRRLEGWDRARWARHLAMKVLAIGDADPPRPPAPAEAAAEIVVATAAAAPLPADAVATAQADVPQIDDEARQAAVSETLAAELEALLASDAPVTESDEFGSGLNYAAGEGAALHDGTFDAPASFDVDATHEAFQATDAPTEEPAVAGPPEFAPMADAEEPVEAAIAPVPAEAVAEAPVAALQLDHLALAPIDEEAVPASARAAAEPVAAAPRLSDTWSLLDDDAPAAAAVDRVDPSDFGIEKVSAADYLAPDAGADESPILPGLSLELVSLEEAIAPQDFEPSHEMVLDMPTSVLPRVIALGATTESTASVGEFLAALPAGLRATVLHTQHLAGRPADDLVEYLSSQCALPVRLAEPGLRARVGEVIVVPSDRQVSLRRDGSVQLQPVEAGAAHVPSIDASFSLAVETFGRDVVAIVFAGRSTDAVAGCQAVRDRGGEVWVEASGSAHAADMVSGVLAENLSHHAGTPAELAARLAEQFTEGQP
jgi:two-component system chemotaxis response regulator CheB/chemosensory pili system protein ChpB (putative protein-glutamate methylesterase)